MIFSSTRGVLLLAMMGMVLVSCGRRGGSRLDSGPRDDGRASGPDHPPVELSLVCNNVAASTYELHLRLNREGIRSVHGLLMEGHVLGQFVRPKMAKPPSNHEQIQQRTREITQTADCLKQSIAKAEAVEFKVQLPHIETSATPVASSRSSSPKAVRKSQYLAAILGAIEGALAAQDWPRVHQGMVELAAALKIAKQNYAGHVFQVQEVDERFAALKAKHAPQGVLLCPDQYNPTYAMETISVANQMALKSMLNKTCVLAGDPAQKKQLRAYLAYLHLMSPSLLGTAWEGVRSARDGAAMAAVLSTLVAESVQTNLVAGLAEVEGAAAASGMSMAEVRASFVTRTLEMRYGERTARELAVWLLAAIDDTTHHR